MGGRWSSLFTEMKPEHKKAMKKLTQNEIVKKYYTENKVERTVEDYLNVLVINPHLIKDDNDKETINKIYKDIVGVNLFRDTYENINENEDEIAIKITPELLKTLKKDYKGVEIAIVDGEEPEEEWSGWVSGEITCDKLSKEDIGDWLVIVDYHN